MLDKTTKRVIRELTEARAKLKVSVTCQGDLFYPRDKRSQDLADLAGRKTFNSHHMELLQALGYTVNVVKFEGP